MMVSTKVVRVYACGGCGINQAKLLRDFEREAEGFAQLSVCYIDTSKSNLSGLDDENTFLIEGLDGSGGIRSENYEVIEQNALSIIQRFGPGDLNIVLGSASGGSGSVLSPVLVRHLLGKDACVIAVSTGSTMTYNEARNSLKTIKSFAGVSKSVGKSLALAYFENSTVQPRSAVNGQITYLITDLRALFSGVNAELDSRDLFNWLYFERPSELKPSLSALSIVGEDDVSEGITHLGTVYSLATLSVGEEAAWPGLVDYRAHGFLPEGLQSKMGEVKSLYFVLSNGPLNDAAEALEKHLTDVQAQQSSRKEAVKVLSDSDDVSDTGMVL